MTKLMQEATAVNGKRKCTDMTEKNDHPKIAVSKNEHFEV